MDLFGIIRSKHLTVMHDYEENRDFCLARVHEPQNMFYLVLKVIRIYLQLPSRTEKFLMIVFLDDHP